MISEAKIRLGKHQDEFLVLSLTLLDKLQDMQLNVDIKNRVRIRRTRDKIRVYWQDGKGGRSYLMVNEVPARDLIDNLMLERTADSHGRLHYEWVSEQR
jgi:hypothetical protein